MARTALATQDVTNEGLEAVYTAANVDGHTCDGGDSVILHVINGDGADKTVTIQTPGTVGGLAIADRAVVVTAGEERFIRLGPSRVFDRPAGGADPGEVYVDFSAVTSVTVAALGI
jgi:hypothetical protein